MSISIQTYTIFSIKEMHAAGQRRIFYENTIS